MRIGLRWKILFFTVLPLAILVAAVLLTVDRSTTRQVNSGLHDDLNRAAAVLENVLAESERSQVVTGQVIVRDPRFFSVLTIPGSSSDRQLRATIVGVAREFNDITQADVFEITDARGRLLASVGRDASTAAERDPLVRAALAGQPVTQVLAQQGGHHLVCVARAMAGGRVVGTLVLGTRIGGDLAERMRQLTRSEVTFVAGNTITGSTLAEARDRSALLLGLPAITGAGAANAKPELAQVHGALHQYITLVRALPRSKPGTGQLYVMQRALDTETAFLRGIQSRLVELGFAAMLAALLIGLFIAQRITAPVQRMVRGAEEMERGNYDYPLEVKSRDEIGTLASSFDAMRRRQREYIRTLQEASQAKSDFVDIASHELNTPVTIIRGYQEMLADGSLGTLTPEQQRAVDVTIGSVDTLQSIAADLTRVTQLEKNSLVIDRDDNNVAECLTEAIAIAKRSAPTRKVEIRQQCAASVGMTSFDRPHLQEALVNLVKNGVRFTPDGGHVEVRAVREGSELVIAVRDTGIGIEPGRLIDLLERPFAARDANHHHSSRTLEFNSRGFGLGLPIARGIVEAHGGKLSVESSVGNGSTFTIRLPAAPAIGLKRAA